MTEATYTLKGNEAQTRILMDTLTTSENWSQHNAVIAMVWKSQWHAAMSIEHINKIGCALARLESVDLQEAMTMLVRKKIFRSYTRRGVRMYEVNY